MDNNTQQPQTLEEALERIKELEKKLQEERQLRITLRNQEAERYSSFSCRDVINKLFLFL